VQKDGGNIILNGDPETLIAFPLEKKISGLWKLFITETYPTQEESSKNSLHEDQFSKIWGFHGGDYEECRLLGYKTPVRTSQETHYIATTESSQLTLCKIWGFHGCDYEECRLLGYKTQVRTSQETHDVSTTESSQLMLCKIWGVHGCDWRMASSGI
jgi:hypothetical protein